MANGKFIEIIMKTRKNLQRISVGIAAYNEEKNVRRILKDILAQRNDEWQLKEILVYDDGSSDNTANEIRAVKSAKIKLIHDSHRRGKTFRLSQMFKTFQGDVLVMFDGDIEFADINVITNLVKAFQDQRIMLAGGNSTPRPPASFFQRCVYTTFAVFYRSRKMIRGGNNIFGCTGSILAIRKYLARTISLPDIINEDAYIYLHCIQNGYLFKYQDSAVIHYALPSNLKDYLRQAFRSHPEAVDVELKKYFGNLVEKEFARPVRFYIYSVFLTFIRMPVEVIAISLIHILCKPFYKIVTSRYKLGWFTAASTH